MLVLGAGGFIGAHAAAALEAAGHRVVRAGRADADFTRNVDAATWAARLRGIDVVVNAVGLFAGADEALLQAVHACAPIALFDACAAAGVRVVQVSALGADERAPEAFLRTKALADDHLLAAHADAVVLRPSLVYGRGGASARLFDALAALPLIPLPGGGRQRIQPVHVGDVAAAIVAAVERPRATPRVLAVVGAHASTLRVFVDALRRQIAGARARFVGIAPSLVRLGTTLGLPWMGGEALAMLERGSTADPAPLARLLERPPRAIDAFVAPGERAAALREARLVWLLPLAKLSLAALWLATAALTLFIWPWADSVAMVERTGLAGPLASAAVMAGALVDAAFGVATLAVRRGRWLWAAQAATIVAYSAIIAVALPEYLAHPFGPVLKNLPVLALIALVAALERR